MKDDKEYIRTFIDSGPSRRIRIKPGPRKTPVIAS